MEYLRNSTEYLWLWIRLALKYANYGGVLCKRIGEREVIARSYFYGESNQSIRKACGLSRCSYFRILKKELYEYIPEAEEFFGKSHPLYVSSEHGVTI